MSIWIYYYLKAYIFVGGIHTEPNALLSAISVAVLALTFRYDSNSLIVGESDPFYNLCHVEKQNEKTKQTNKQACKTIQPTKLPNVVWYLIFHPWRTECARSLCL